MPTQSALWAEISKLLRNARAELPENAGVSTGGVPRGPLAGTLKEFEEFLEHNELELAWDALAQVAEQLAAPPSIWQKMERAAKLMQLPDKEGQAAEHVRSARS
jgi:hypothetical protein